MAYIVWRVILKKYSKIRLGVQRNLSVNGREDETNHTARGGGIENNVPSGSIALSTSGEFPETPTEPSTTQSVSEDLTLTNKARRKKVRNYLKRKNKRTNSIAPSSEESLPSLLQQDDNNITTTISNNTTSDENNGFTIIRNRNSRRQKSNNIIHHNRSSWYIDRNNITSDIMGSKESHIIKENARPNSMVHYISHHGDNDEEEGEVVLTKCNTTTTDKDILEEVNTPVHVEKVEVDTGQQQEECGVTEGNNVELRRVAASLASLDSITSVLTDTTITAQDTENIENIITPAPPSIEEARDVASLVAILFAPLYPNFALSRSTLTRQARDLLVCRYHGNISRFETEFLRPAAELLTGLKDTWRQEHSVIDDDVTVPYGWPFSLSTSGVVIHLGELENSSIRTRDCYLCVRPTDIGPEVVLIWRGIGGHDDIQSTSLKNLPAPINMEELITSDDSLVGLLHNVLISVERAIDRVPLDQLTFPCPCSCECPSNTRSHPLCQPCTCHDQSECTCKCHNINEESTITDNSNNIQHQTSSNIMFDFVNSIPHIDSDTEEETTTCNNTDDVVNVNDVKSRLNGTTVAVNNVLTVQVPPPPPPTLTDNEPPLVTPSCVAELPPDHLSAGVTLTACVDVDGRPIVVFEALAVQRAALQRRDIARLLLFYASVLNRRKENREIPNITILIPRIESAASLELLDQSLLLTQPQLRVARAVLRKQPGGPTKLRRVLPETGVKLHVVGCEAGSLRRFVSDSQLPKSCGGTETTDRDPTEWFAVLAEAEQLSAACHGAGRRLASALADLRDAEAPLAAGNTGTLPSSARRLLHHQHRVLSRALAEPTLQETRSQGPITLQNLERRVRDTCEDCQDLRGAIRRGATLLCELERAAQRLERLAEGRREKIRDLARLRALEDETSQELSWLREKGEEALRHNAELATTLPAIKQQELDFVKFYFIAMRHLDRGGDLVEEAALQPPGTTSGGGGALHNLARSLKQHLRGFSDRLEDTRERLEDTSRCFYLLDKAYEWALEAKKYVSRTETVGAEQSLQALKQLQHYLMAHPAPCESHFTEMSTLARKLNNDKLAEQCKVAHARCQETLDVIRTQRSRLSGNSCSNNDSGICSPMSSSGLLATSTPLSAVRRRSLPAPASAICAPFSAGHTCGCWDTNNTSDPDSRSANCSAHAAASRPLSLGDIKEVRESAENLLETSETDNISNNTQRQTNNECDNLWCDKCGASTKKHPLRRSCTWQHPTENFEEDVECSRDDGKCDNCSIGESHSAAGDSTPEENTEESAKMEEASSKSPLPPVPVNSHLHHHASSLDLPLSTDQNADPRDLKTQKTLLLIMREMIQTERDYVRSLEYVIENFIPELMREDIPQAMRGQRNVVFGNIEKIYEFHSQFFLQELEKCEARPLAVGQSFLRHENKFYLYALYNKNKPKSDSLMSEYGTSFFRKKQLELGDRMDLASYLLKPVQRMGKYALLLQQLVKAQGEGGEATQVTDLKAAEAMVRFQLRHGNDLLAMDSLRDCDINVKEQGRLLRQNEFLVWQGKGKKCLRHVFLFEELILFSKARRFPDRKNLDLYIYKHSMKMTDIGLTAMVTDSPSKFEIWFRKRKPNDTFVLQTMNEEVKQVWTEEISRLLWKQALRNREVRMVEMSSMGIGNKPCLDIRPSADQISDRSISIAQLSKTAPRFRNSVVLGSGEQLVRSRRPHSIISVGGSSTTSSSSASGGGGGGSSSGGSCGSCHSNYGTLNLDESPSSRTALHHRSGTLHSQCSIESGIIADMSLSSEENTESSGTGHWLVERSNSSATSASLDSSLSPSSPLSPLSPVAPLPGQGEEGLMSIKL